MEYEKWIGKSTTVVSALFMFVVSMLPVLQMFTGWQILPEDVNSLRDAVIGVISAVGSTILLIVNIRGRMQANTKLTLGKPTNPAPAP